MYPKYFHIIFVAFSPTPVLETGWSSSTLELHSPYAIALADNPPTALAQDSWEQFVIPETWYPMILRVTILGPHIQSYLYNHKKKDSQINLICGNWKHNLIQINNF